jgi:hypothetical protein
MNWRRFMPAPRAGGGIVTVRTHAWIGRNLSLNAFTSMTANIRSCKSRLQTCNCDVGYLLAHTGTGHRD